jgi:hypothetical protein
MHHRTHDLVALSRMLLLRAADSPSREVRRKALVALLDHVRPKDVVPVLHRFLRHPEPSGLLRDEDLAQLVARGLTDGQIQALLEELARCARDGPGEAADAGTERAAAVTVVRLLSMYGVAHPVWYARVRLALARLASQPDAGTAARAGEELDRLQLGFRAWIGPNLRLASDPGSGHEYCWLDAVSFDSSVGERHRDSIVRAVTETSLVRESIFLFGQGQLLSLADVPPGGVRISHLGTNHGKSVFRVSVHTRAHTQFDFALNVADSLPVADLREEIRWLLAAGAPPPLVEEFGGWYAEYGMFTEEFIPGETVDKQIRRLEALGAVERLKVHWPFLVWTAFSAHVDFWLRTRCELALEPSPANIIVPSHDYQTGARLVSISRRRSSARLLDILDDFRRSFIGSIEEAHPALRGLTSPVILLSAAVEVMGTSRAAALFMREAADDAEGVMGAFAEALRARGFTPQRLYFAIQRYVRWLAMNPEATVEARGVMLAELWEAYGLDEVEKRYPDARVRFFRQTVFRGARQPIADALERLLSEARAGSIHDHGSMSERIASLRGSVQPTAEEDYFLARMAYRDLQPDDDVTLISLPDGERQVTDLVVTLEDAGGQKMRVRAPVSPREVARLLHLFHEANLQVAFSAEHEYLVVLDPVERVIGGLYYRLTADGIVQMEKVVVQQQHRRKGVSDGLMHDFFRRLRSRGAAGVVTGFFRPEYMQRFGFKVEPQYGGMFRSLESPVTRSNSHRPPPIAL